MTSAIQNNFLVVDQAWLDSHRKPSKPLFERITDYTEKTIGTFRVLQLIKNLCSLRNKISWPSSSIARSIETDAGVALSLLGLLRLPTATQEAISSTAQALKGYQEGKAVQRKTVTAIKKFTEATASWAYAALFVSAHSLLRSAALISVITYDVCDLGISYVDYHQSATAESLAKDETKEAYTQTKKYNMLRIAKSMISLFASTVNIGLSILGGPAAPVLAMTLLSLLGNSIAIRRDLYKEEEYPIIDYDKL